MFLLVKGLLFLLHSCGGVEVVSKNGKIKCNNTLENRLYAITQHTLPMIRAELFGPNPNRKHHD